MKKNTLYILLLVFIAISACKKEESVSHLVKSITIGSKTSTFTYDAQKRVTQISVSNNKRYEFAYFNTDSVVRYDYDGAAYLGRTQFLFNNNGKNTTTHQYFPAITELIHVFNTNNDMYYLIHSIASPSSQTTDSIIHTNKNATTIVHTVLSAGPTTREIINIEYNDRPNTLNNESFGMKFLASFFYSTLDVNSLAYIYNATNQNLPIKEGDNITYTYEFDEKGRITKRTRKNTTAFVQLTTEQFTYYE